MPRPDEGMIHAWLDGELDAAEAARIASLVERDSEWAAAAAEARGLIAASSRIVSALDVVPGDVIPSRTSATGVVKPRFTVRPWMRIAAGVVLVVGIGYLARPDTSPVPVPVANEEVAKDTAPVAAVSVAPQPEATVPVSAPAVASERAAKAPAQPERRAEADALGEQRRAAVASGAGMVAPAPPPASTQIAPTPVTVLPTEAPAAAAPVAPAAPRILSGLADTSSLGVRRRATANDSREREKSAVAQLSPRTVIDRDGPAELARSDFATSQLEGCWRTATAANADSVLRAPAIVRQAGDSLVITIARPTRLAPLTASVVRVGADELRGTTRDRNGQPVAFAAARITCP